MIKVENPIESLCFSSSMWKGFLFLRCEDLFPSSFEGGSFGVIKGVRYGIAFGWWVFVSHDFGIPLNGVVTQDVFYRFGSLLMKSVDFMTSFRLSVEIYFSSSFSEATVCFSSLF